MKNRSIDSSASATRANNNGGEVGMFTEEQAK